MLLLITKGFVVCSDRSCTGSSLERIVPTEALDALIDGEAREEAESNLVGPEISSGLNSEEEDVGTKVPGE